MTSAELFFSTSRRMEPTSDSPIWWRWMNTSRKQAKVRGCSTRRTGLMSLTAFDNARRKSVCDPFSKSIEAVKQYESKSLHRSFRNSTPCWLRIFSRCDWMNIASMRTAALMWHTRTYRPVISGVSVVAEISLESCYDLVTKHTLPRWIDESEMNKCWQGAPGSSSSCRIRYDPQSIGSLMIRHSKFVVYNVRQRRSFGGPRSNA